MSPHFDYMINFIKCQYIFYDYHKIYYMKNKTVKNIRKHG